MSVDLLEILKDDIKQDESFFEDEIKLLRVQYLKKTNKLNVIIKSVESINEYKQNKLKNIISKRLGCFECIDLICYRDMSNISLEQVAKEYWIYVVNSIINYMPISREYLTDSLRKVEGNVLSIHSSNSFLCEFLKNRDLELLTEKTIEDIFGINCKINLAYDCSITQKDYFIEKDEKEKKLLKRIVEQKISTTNDRIDKSNRKEESKQNTNVIIGKNITDGTIDIKDINEPMGIVVIEGDIFKTDIIETKTGKKIITFYITDFTSSIIVKHFIKPKDEERILEEIKVGLHCKVRGDAINDIYAKEIALMAKDVIKTDKIQKMDTSEEKRVELHLHTQMSAMDGMSPVSKLVERAAKWGHKAIAITDHGVVQAFPEAMEAAKKNKIKILYGVEAYLVDDGMPVAFNCPNKSIEDTYVVFDIETTGLSSQRDRITEIGAVKICNSKVVDRFSEFVNPDMHIPQKITELTSITDEMVKDAENISVIIKKFIDFIGDAIVVAHNAPFDVAFIKKCCKDNNINFNNGIIDTIPLCRFVYPDLKRFKLDVVCKHLGISLNNHHRAVNDANATGEILLCCFKELTDKNIFDIESLNNEYFKAQDIKKLPTYHLIILVKNMIGLKNLYKLISFSNLDYFFKKPRMSKSLIKKYKEGLIIGSACEAGQIYRELLQGKSDDELKDLISFYDYLEIQPLGNNEFMLRNGTAKDNEQLMDINKRICDLGEKYSKPVVATGDVHFLDESDEIFRRILMRGQGFSDADNQPPLYFKTTKEMLQEFSYLGQEKAREVVIVNPNRIADLIEDIKPIPDETFPPKIEGAEDELKNMSYAKAYEIYGDPMPEIVKGRLDKELNSIISNGYAVLYLIAHKLVTKSLSDGYLVGSRGSVGSSFAATMFDITEVNGLPPHYICPKCKHSEFFTDGSIGSGADLPDKICPKCGENFKKDGHDIPFETFLGFEGDKEPDIDLNFSGNYQPVVHKYTEVLFGEGHVFRAGTIGTVAEKTAFGFVKKYLEGKNITVPMAEIERLTIGCTGVKRTTGQHPGGVMVVPSDNEIYNFTPIQHPADDNNTEIITTHFDYHSISGRLLKLDILGHDDPTVLRMLQDLTGIDPKTIPLGDPKVMSLFTSTEALGVTPEQLNCEVGTYGLPEFGTKFVRKMLIDTQPKTFADLVRISGLSHGTDVWVNNAQYYIKEGCTTLKDCISTRDDIMTYLIHMNLPPKSAFTIMEKVRKGKGLTEEHELLMKEHEVPQWYIESCKKIKYMFPKGHAVAYVMMAVRIAYFKVYYPKVYYATYFTVRANDFDADLIVKGEETMQNKIREIENMGNDITQKDKGLLTILELCYEMYKRGIKFLKVDIYKSDAIKFLLHEDGIRPPLKALQGVGENAAKSIMEARQNGEFISKEDLRLRTKVSKTVIQTLANHGCLNGLPETNQLCLF